ncbi:hypothetical protein B566_EDAN013197 [Ephemera danica]|nr:hypothetical protein B566_EDAN013197 [Ephemera danica]
MSDVIHKCKSGGASRPSSPGIGPGNGSVNCSGGGGVVTSLIPTPRSASRTDKPINQIKSATGTGARSLRPPSYTSSGSTNVMLNHSGSGQSTLERGMKHPQNVVHSNPNVPSTGATTTTSNNTTPSSVLDKFKFFNSPPRSTKQGDYLRKPLKDSVALVCPMPLISESTSPAVSSPLGVQVSMFAKGVSPGETPSPTQAPPSSAQQQCVGVTVGASDTLHVREFDLRQQQQQPQHQPTNILADKVEAKGVGELTDVPACACLVLQGVPGETLQVTTDTVNASTGDDEEAGMRVKPMQPLSYVRPGIFNGDRQRTCFMPEILRLSRRNGTFLSGSNFADLDMAAGYLSDGEVLRGGGSSGSLLEPADGYLSEGAASLYMRRAMRDSLEDDSSSLSSEVSEPLNELSEERHLEKKRLPDNNICETQINGYTNSPGGPGGELDSSGSHQHHHHHQQQQHQQQQGLRPVLKVVSSRQLVKKADSSQQTESSAFRQGNHWKRYPIPEGGNGGSSGGSGKPSLESRPELRRGKSDLGEQREKSREKNRDRVDKLQQERAAAVVNGGGTKEEERRSSSRGSQGGSSSKGSGGGVTLQQQSSGSEASSPGSSRPRGGGNGNNSHHVRVPASFGYVSKRANSNVSVCSNRSHTSSSANGKANEDLSRTAQVSAVPRNSESNTNSGQRPRHSKVKISGGTQTTSSDINPSPVEYNTTPSPSRRGSSSSYKSYSLTAPTASQLSANVRERLLLVGGNSHSLPKASNAGNTSLPNEYAHALFASSPRTGPRAGSLSDTTGYSNYSELTGNTGGNSGNGYYGVPGVGSPYSWLRHSSTYNASIATARCNAANSSLTESTDSLSSLGSQHRTSLSHARILMHPRDGSPGPRLNRSNSIRSTKSEKLYPSMLQRSEDLLLDSYYNSVLSASTTGPSQTMHRPAPDSQASQPTSPTPSQGNNRFNFPLSSSASSHGLSRPTTMSPYLISSKISCKDDEMHGSSLSLVSTASSLYSTAEEKQAHEIRKLRRELMEAQDKVHTLTNQLSTN